MLFRLVRIVVAGGWVVCSAASLPAQPAGGPQIESRVQRRDGYAGPVLVVPNFHPASCGWLADFSTERNYCAYSYLDHLDRVRDDAHYRFALSEVNNIMAIMEFEPARVEELKQRVREGRVELVNAFFLEPTINLSGGEALVKMGVEGLRWQQQVMGARPRQVWAIDVTGVHEQMGQITAALGLDALVYTRDNPTGSVLHWLESPDGTRILCVSPGHYSEWGSVFSSPVALNEAQLKALAADVQNKARRTPAGAPVLVLGGAGDYALPPVYQPYPSEFLSRFKQVAPDLDVRFTTPREYLDAVLPAIRDGRVELPTTRSGARLSWTSFWIQCPRVKAAYRHAEQALQAAEMAATAASLKSEFRYPVQPLYHAWLQMLLNMDRNTLWGAAGGMVFEHPRSWDASDRFESVEAISAATSRSALRALLGEGEAIGLFNPLGWRRNDPLRLKLPVGVRPAGATCQSEPDGTTLCRLELPSLGAVVADAEAVAAPAPQMIDFPRTIETACYTATIDPQTGALASLKVKPSGREVLAGPVLLVAERGLDGHNTPRRPERKRLADARRFPAQITVCEGPVATVVQVRSTFYGGGAASQTIHFYRESPRIDFDVELNDLPDKTVVVAEFPLAGEIKETRRGIPYGFSHAAWGDPQSELAGYADGIQAAIRWSHYTLAGGGGVAILDRGLPGRELTGNTPVVFLLNAQDTYLGYPGGWLSGQGPQRAAFALLAHDGDWNQARIPQMAWEFNSPPVVVAGVGRRPPTSFVETSDNVIIEAVRREGREIELRLAECLGRAATARVTVTLPHERAALTDLVGGRAQPLPGGPQYEFPVRPQQIVTLRLATAEAVPEIQPLLEWDELVPAPKLAALKTRLPGCKGHPPRGGRPQTPAPTLPAEAAKSLTRGRKAAVSNVYRNMDAHQAAMAVDGNPATRWASDGEIDQATLDVDLGEPQVIGRAYLSEAYDRVRQFELQALIEGRWQTFARGGKIGTNLEITFPPVTAQQVRLNITDGPGGPTIWEFMLFAPK
jgi:alpha-mannosidase